MFTHPGAVFVLAPALAVAALRLGVWRRPRLVAELVVLGLVLGLLDLPVFAAFWHLGALTQPFSSAEFLQGGYLRFVGHWWVHLLASAPGAHGGAGCLLLLAPLAVLGWALGIRGENREVCLPLAATALACFGLAYGSSGWAPTRLFQPYRFLIPFSFLLCVPGGRAVVWSAEALLPRRPLLAFGALLVVVAVVGEAALRLLPSIALGSGDDPTEDALVEFLTRETSREDRIAIESPWAQQAAYPGASRLISVQRFRTLPLRVDREFIGHGGLAHINVHRYAGFWGSSLLGRKLADLGPLELQELLDRYALSWLVAVRPHSIELLRRFPTVLEEAATVTGAVAFRVRVPARSRLLEGTGRATASLDRIEVRDAAGDRLVLKYHWLPTLRVNPPVVLEEAPQPKAPVGFIAVRPGGVRDFDIVHRGGL